MTSRHIAFAAILSASACTILCAPAFSAESVPAYVTAAVNDGGRGNWEIPRDAARKPAEVLAFSQIKPGQAVADYVPGEGYYTRLLAKLVGANGRLYALVPGGDGGAPRDMHIQQREGHDPSFVPRDEAERCMLGCYPVGRPPFMLPIDFVMAIQNIAEYKNVTVLWEDVGQFGGNFGVPEQLDAVFSANGYHVLHENVIPDLPSAIPGRIYNRKPLDNIAVSRAIFRAIKPGGVYVITDYAAAAGAGFSVADSLGRTDPEAVKAEVTAAGFVFDGESKALANAADDHRKIVNGTAAERDKMDQYLLRFRKPANAPAPDKRPKGADPLANYYGNTVILGPELKALGKDGRRIRVVYYNKDGTYQEFGRVGEGPAPMQAGTWYWDADGHNCMIHQFPIDERQSIVCHEDISAHPIGVVEKQKNGAGSVDVIIVKGHMHP